jgi:hypothetical protein
VPQVIGTAGALFTGVFLFLSLFVERRSSGTVKQNLDIGSDHGDLTGRQVYQRAGVYFGWCLAYLAGAALIGLVPALFFFMTGYLRFVGRETWRMTLSVAVPAWIFCYVLFHQVLLVPWPATVLGDFFPALKSIRALNLF